MMTRVKKAWIGFIATRLLGIAADALVVAFAHFTAFVLRFDFAEPVTIGGWSVVAQSYATVAIVYVCALLAAGCYRHAWRRVGFADLPRYLAAMAGGFAVLTLARYFLPEVSFSHLRPPYSITLITFFLTVCGVLALRLFWRFYCSACRRDGELLLREEKTFDNSVAARFFAGRTVMVTGAGGTIGSEIVRQLAAAGAAKILMVERCENALYEIDRSMRGSFCSSKLRPLMLDINDSAKMDALFAAEKPSVVLHAAAYKHVPMVEFNPEEGWRNNTEATKILARLSAAHSVKRFVLISTDKAVNPVSVMGKTKL
ncbi:MAG: SDR family NAD(P)-dependent oxidoreductase, partial [Clostridia bacterium]|nr:SDR family NAD(P)-dependent oxidoreductase [Clostridia bacterium]